MLYMLRIKYIIKLLNKTLIEIKSSLSNSEFENSQLFK